MALGGILSAIGLGSKIASRGKVSSGLNAVAPEGTST